MKIPFLHALSVATVTSVLTSVVPLFAQVEAPVDRQLLWQYEAGPVELPSGQNLTLNIPGHVLGKTRALLLEIEAFIPFHRFGGWNAALVVTVGGWELREAADRGEYLALRDSEIRARWTGGWAVPLAPSYDDLKQYEGMYQIREESGFRAGTILFRVEAPLRMIVINNGIRADVSGAERVLSIQAVRLWATRRTEGDK